MYTKYAKVVYSIVIVCPLRNPSAVYRDIFYPDKMPSKKIQPIPPKEIIFAHEVYEPHQYVGSIFVPPILLLFYHSY